jgi:hypothetical protein
MSSAASTTRPAPEPAPTIAQLWAQIAAARADIAATRRLTAQALAVRDGDVADALVLNEGRLSVTSDAIDHLAAAVTTAGLAAPAAAVRPVAAPGPACVPPQRTRADRPLMVLLPRT